MTTEQRKQTDISTKFFGLLLPNLQQNLLKRPQYNSLKHQSSAKFDMVCDELLLIPHERASNILRNLPDSLREFTQQLQESNPNSSTHIIDTVVHGMRLATQGTIILTTFYAALQKATSMGINSFNMHANDFSDDLYRLTREVVFPDDAHLLETSTEDGMVIAHPLEKTLQHYIGLITEDILKEILHTHPLSDEGIRLTYDYRLAAHSTMVSLLY